MPVALESSEQPLNLVPKLVEFAVVVPFDSPVRLRRHDRRYLQGLHEAEGLLAEPGLEAALELGCRVGPDRADTIRHRRITARSRALGSPGTTEVHTRYCRINGTLLEPPPPFRRTHDPTTEDGSVPALDEARRNPEQWQRRQRLALASNRRGPTIGIDTILIVWPFLSFLKKTSLIYYFYYIKYQYLIYSGSEFGTSYAQCRKPSRPARRKRTVLLHDVRNAIRAWCLRRSDPASTEPFGKEAGNREPCARLLTWPFSKSIVA